MKFKYNYLENKLWKLAGEYSYEVAENNHFHTQKGTYGSDGWFLGNQERIIFSFAQTLLTIYYQQANLAYQKNLDLPVNGEIIFAFTEQDRINSS